MPLQALCIISYPLVNSNWSYNSETPNLGQIRVFVEPCDLEIWQMTLQNYRAPLLCYFKLCASFCSHSWIQTRVTVQKRPIWVKFDDFKSRLALKFDGWPWKTIRHLKANLKDLIAATGLVILLKLDSNRQFPPRVNLKFDGWPQNKIGHLFYATLSFLHHFVAIGGFKLELQSGNA